MCPLDPGHHEFTVKPTASLIGLGIPRDNRENGWLPLRELVVQGD